MSDPSFEAKIPRVESRPVPWAPLINVLRSITSALPEFRDSKRGRSGARQFKLVMFCVAVALLFLGASAWTIVGCAIFLLSAALLPISELRKRSLLRRLKLMRRRERRRTQAATIKLETKRCALVIDEKVDRRVLTNRVFSMQRAILDDGRPVIVLFGERQRKRDTIWIIAEKTGSLSTVTDAAQEEPLQIEDLENPAVVTTDDFVRLKEVLRERLEASSRG